MVTKPFLLLTLASVIVLIDQAQAKISSQCATTNWGTKIGNVVQIPTVYLNPNVQSWVVDLQLDELCNGAEVTVCEVDMTPNVKFLSQSIVYVYLNGSLRGSATLNRAIYCNEENLQSKY